MLYIPGGIWTRTGIESVIKGGESESKKKRVGKQKARETKKKVCVRER